MIDSNRGCLAIVVYDIDLVLRTASRDCTARSGRKFVTTAIFSWHYERFDSVPRRAAHETA